VLEINNNNNNNKFVILCVAATLGSARS
jgi:hypothetical protein